MTNTSPTRAVRRTLLALALLAAIVVGGLSLSPAPAGASEYPASHAQIGGSSHGFVSFETDGDKFILCDTRPDGYSIGVEWWIWNASAGRYIKQDDSIYNYWGSDTCRTVRKDLHEGTYIAYRAALYDDASPGGDPVRRVDGTFGRTVYANSWNS